MTRGFHRWLLLAGLVVAGCPIEYTVPLDSDGETSGSESDESESDDGDEDDDSDDECDPPLLVCNESCIDPRTDPANCDGCDNDCGPGGTCVESECVDPCNNTCDPIVEVCVAGTCECRPGFDRCDGTCVDLDIDPLNCGECDELCVEEDGKKLEVYLCQAGDCRDDDVGCDEGLSQCGQSCVDRQTHPLHCGACNRSCDGDQVCIDGECLDT